LILARSERRESAGIDQQLNAAGDARLADSPKPARRCSRFSLPWPSR
jgi:hypothetical protein